MRKTSRILLGVGLPLFILINLWLVSINRKICWPSYSNIVSQQPQVMPSPPLPKRRSVTLTYDNNTYHLNLTQHEVEYPFLQSYICTLLEDSLGHCRSAGGAPLLLLAIKSHPASSDRRAALRRTWAAEGEISGYQIKRLFLLATVPNVGHMNLVEKEVKEFQDILMWNFTESHYNLSLKERCFLDWLHHNCKEAEFIFKGDDDVLMNPTALIQYLGTIGNISRTLHGNLMHRAVVFRGGKYAVTNTLFPYLHYPTFLSGGGFIISRNVIPGLFLASLELPVFPLDDVYLGFLGVAANVTMVHNPRFYLFGLGYNICQYKQALVVHQFTSESLVKIWPELQEAKCDQK
ncbi:UDP-GlcNAc:betaGal beta-1,3-N-acetylglucosaminyltransferase 9-like [Ambystoma mexicanum]|uniref:UDP-GlcNAc:betaGal beta-1,3-N-acetylglucosaminyltransferase 9-like n=1 Tax=Ambystoma mexicanum TaxID=8296 RepID=UPI0037E979BD